MNRIYRATIPLKQPGEGSTSGMLPMDRECERCGNPIDLLGREPFLPELLSYLCASCERIAAEATLQLRDEQAFQAESRHAA